MELLRQSTATFTDTIPAFLTTAGDYDDSEIINHRRAKDTNPSRCRTAFGLWCHETGISRPQYKSLLEIFRMPEFQQEAYLFPSCLSTLKSQTIAHLPLLPMRKKSIPLQPEQLGREKPPTTSSSIVPHADLYFFDPIGLFTTFLRSEICNQMHFGLGEFRDNPRELWHSHAWRSSLRTTSGRFAHYVSGKPIFPSDIISFRCYDPSCPSGCYNLSATAKERQHVGRVYSVGKDFRSGIREQGVVTVEVQQVLLPLDLQGVNMQPPLLSNEGLLSWNRFHMIAEDHITSRIDTVFLDYFFNDDKLNPGSRRPVAPPQSTLIIRRIHDIGAYPEHFPPSITPLCKSHPLRGELELETFGRAHFERFDQLKTVSLPLLTFIDGFGLYRNIYRECTSTSRLYHFRNVHVELMWCLSL